VSTAIWLPDRHVTTPRATLVTELDRWGRPPGPSSAWEVQVGPAATSGLIPVGVTHRAEVLAHPPDAPALQSDPWTSRALRAVAALLDDALRRDRQGRRGAAHKDSRTLREIDFVMARRRFGGLPVPDPRERRDWRLGGEASFREWMARRGYPVARDTDIDEDDEAV
jgi:hypothetical protein